MASYSYKVKETTDLCHYILASEKDFGVQCIILRDANTCKECSPHYYSLFKTHFETAIKQSGAAFLQVSSPGKAFEKFDHEKYKLVLPARAYFKILEFFNSEWPLVQKRCESDYQDMKEKKEWISLTPSISFRGPADAIYKQTLDVTNSASLDLTVIKRCDTGKTNITVAYSEGKLGTIHLPPGPMVELAQECAYISSLYDYKEAIITKRSRQS